MSTPDHRLRPSAASDFDWMMRVAHEGLRPHVEPLCGWDQAEHEREFARRFDPATLQVIECGGQPVGYLQLQEAPDHTMLAGLYLHADWRGRGLGGAVLERLCADADRRARTLRLRVHRGSPALRLYRRHGFVASGEAATQVHMTRSPNDARGATAMPRIVANHHVLAVPDAERSARWFLTALDFTLLPVVDPGWRFVRRDGVMLMLGSCPDAIAPAELGDHAYFAYFVVDDVDGCYEQVRAAGGDALAAPADKPWRMREFPLRTLDGHRIMIGEDMDAGG